MSKIQFIKPFNITFKSLYDLYERKEISFLGINILGGTFWLPIRYEKDKPQIRMTKRDEEGPEIFDAIFDWGEEAMKFITDVVSYIRKKQGDLKNMKYINHAICEKCGGDCCRATGCYYSPRDFKEISFQSLCNLICKGYTSIIPVSSIFTGLETSLVLKVRNINQETGINDRDLSSIER